MRSNLNAAAHVMILASTLQAAGLTATGILTHLSSSKGIFDLKKNAGGNV